MNNTNPYASGTEVAGEPGVASTFSPGLWLLALLAGAGGGWLVTVPAAELTRNPEYLLGLPFAVGAIFCLVATRLRAWWGFVGGAVLGAILGIPLGDTYNFTRGSALPVQLWAACTVGCCLACVGAVVAAFVEKKFAAGVAAIILVILAGVLALLIAEPTIDSGSPVPPDLSDQNPPPVAAPAQATDAPDPPEPADGE